MSNCHFCKFSLSAQALFCSNCGKGVIEDSKTISNSGFRSTSSILPSSITKSAIRNTIFVAHPSVSNSLNDLVSRYGLTPLCMVFDRDSESITSKVRNCLNSSDYGSAKFVCIIGNWEDVAPYYLPNPLVSDDGDEFCQSDAPYGCKSEFLDDDIFSIIPSVQVGRIPTRDINTIERALFITPQIPQPQNSLLFGVSDSCWTEATHAIVNSFKGESPEVLDSVNSSIKNIPKGAVIVSPDWEESNLKGLLGGGLQKQHNLMLFNVHGGADEPSWKCQSGPFSYIEIFRPGTIADFNDSVLVTEACYGGALGYDEPSVVEHFFANRGLAFVGSSNIAYGSCSESLCGADLIALHFLEGLAKGMNYGDALNFAKLETVAGDPDSEDVARKSVMSFNLFGAPWHCVTQNSSATLGDSGIAESQSGQQPSVLDQIRARNTGFRRSIEENITLDDWRGRYQSRLPPRLALFAINQAEALERIRQFDDFSKIEKLIDDWQSNGNHFELKSIKSKVDIAYRLMSRSKDSQNRQNITIVLIDSRGKIKKTMTSKGIV